MTTVRIHGIARSTTALGPGNRAAIWFQGCMRSCKGCMSPDSRPLNGGTEWIVDKLVGDICAIENIEGITISGGEPFLQIDSRLFLSTICCKLFSTSNKYSLSSSKSFIIITPKFQNFSGNKSLFFQ